MNPAARAVEPKPQTAAQAQRAAPSPSATQTRPDIRISGSSWSKDPFKRLLIVNGKVVREGQEVSPGLMLEKVAQRMSTFNEGGRRFELRH
jgi:general secretion pathway protein B